MATQLDTAHLLGVAALTDVGGETVTIEGLEYKAVVGSVDERDELAEGGVRQIRSVSVAIARSAFDTSFLNPNGSLPTMWKRITVRGQELQVMSVSQDLAVVELTAGGLAE